MRLCRDWVAAGKVLPMEPPPEYPHLTCSDRVLRGLPDVQFSNELNAALEDELGKKNAIWDAMVSDIEQLQNDDAWLKEHRTSFGSRPVRVITATPFHDTPATPSAARLEHMRLSYSLALGQSRLLELSSNSKQIFSDTGILVQFEKPELVLQTIRGAWEQSK